MDSSSYPDGVRHYLVELIKKFTAANPGVNAVNLCLMLQTEEALKVAPASELGTLMTVQIRQNGVRSLDKIMGLTPVWESPVDAVI